jgi:hypothetical protein
MFPHRNFLKRTWNSPDGKTQNQIDHTFLDRKLLSNTVDVRWSRGVECDTDHYLKVEMLGKEWQ